MPETEVTSELLGQFDDRRANLIPILQEIQARHFYLPEESLRRVARKLQIPVAEVYQVATFYRCFSLKPRGKHLVQVCTGTACHVRGGDLVLERTQTEAASMPAASAPTASSRWSRCAASDAAASLRSCASAKTLSRTWSREK